MTNEELKIKLNTPERPFADVGTDYPPNSQNQDYFGTRTSRKKTNVPKRDYSNEIGYTLKGIKMVDFRV